MSNELKSSESKPCSMAFLIFDEHFRVFAVCESIDAAKAYWINLGGRPCIFECNEGDDVTKIISTGPYGYLGHIKELPIYTMDDVQKIAAMRASHQSKEEAS